MHSCSDFQESFEANENTIVGSWQEDSCNIFQIPLGYEETYEKEDVIKVCDDM